MIEAPFEAAGILIANPVEDAIVFFFYAFFEPVGSKNRDQGERDQQRTDEREGHGVGHGMKKFTGRAAESVDRKIAGNDDGDGIKNGAIDIARSVQENFVELVILAMAFAEFSVDVFNHDDGAVNDDAEVDGADGEQVGGFSGEVQEDKSEKQGKWNGQRGDNRGADTDSKKYQNDQNENHAAKKVA